MKIITKFSRKTGQLLPLIVNLVDYAIWGIFKSECTIARFVMLII